MNSTRKISKFIYNVLFDKIVSNYKLFFVNIMKKYSICVVFVFLGLLMAGNVKATVVEPIYTATISTLPEMGVPITLHLDPVAGVGGLDFVLSSSNPTSGWYFTNANASACTTTLTENLLHMNASTANKNFCYFDSTPGTYTLTSTNSQSTTALQEITVVGNPVDTTNPILGITMPIGNSYTNDNMVSNLNFTASDDTDEILDYAVYVDDESAQGEPVATGTILSGGSVGTSVPPQTDGRHTITIKVSDNAGNFALKSVVVNIDTVNPILLSAETSAPYNAVQILFDENLQNNEEGHYPQVHDFDVYNGETSYGIESVSYENKKVTIILTNPILKGDKPVLYVYPALASLVDLANNYFNGGEGYNMPIQVEQQTSTISGGKYIPREEPIKIPGCAERVDGYSTIDGKSCANNIPHEDGWVLGAEKFNFTLLLKREQPPYSTGAYMNEVLELQKFLNANGYESGPEDGKFGPLTEGAVIRFQLANGLVGDGVVGPLTRAVLDKQI